MLSYLLLNGYGLVKSGQTIGKRLFGIALVPTTDQAVPVWRLVFVRGVFFALAYTIVLLPIAPLIVVITLIDHLLIFGQRRRCLHDLAAGTIVIRKQ